MSGRATGAGPPRVAYLVSRYPALSHTFIVREVRALRELGIDVATFSVRAPAGDDLRSATAREEHERTEVLLPAGAGALVGALARALRRSPTALASTARFALGRGARRGPRAFLWQVFYLLEALLLWRRLDALGIRHVHAHFANVGADVARLVAHLGRRADRQGGWRWSFTMHGPAEFWSVAEHDLPAKVADADLVVCISDFCRSQLMGLVPADRWDRLTVVHCGVDPAAVQPSGRHGGAGALGIVTVGRLVPVKGHAVLLDAVARLRAGGVEASVTVVGEGPERAALEQLAHRLGLGGRVAFTGPLAEDDVTAVLARSDVFCLPSFAEGVPVVLMEAMAAGLPVVTTRIAGVPELVTDGVSGFLVAPGRADLLAGALGELAADPERRAEMGEAGRRAVEEGFDVRASAAALAAAFRASGRRSADAVG